MTEDKSFKSFLQDKRVLAYSDFVGYILRVKDGYIKFSPYDSNGNYISYIRPEYTSGLPQFISVYTDKPLTQTKEYLYTHSNNYGKVEKDTIVIANSACNLNCSYCVVEHKNRRRFKFPSPDQINTIKHSYEGIENLYITGGEPTTEMGDLKSILSTIGKELRVTIYTNGTNLTREFISFLAELPQITRLSISISTDSTPGGHMDVESFFTVLESIEDLLNEKILLSICLVDAQQGRELDTVFKYLAKSSYVNLLESINLTGPPMHYADCLDDYSRYINNILSIAKAIQDLPSPKVTGKPLSTLNLNMYPNQRGNIGCNIKMVSMFGPRLGLCVYDTDPVTETVNSPLDYQIKELASNVCLSSCSSYPYECKSNFATENCIAYKQVCLTCPAMPVCHNRCVQKNECHIQDDPSNDACLYMALVYGFELWLWAKDKTSKEISELYNSGIREK